MAGLTDLVMDIIKLTDTVKTLDNRTEKLTEKINDIDKRVVRLETLVEVTKLQQISSKK